MRVSDIIERKKQGLANTQEEIHHLIQGYVTEEVPDYQVSAWLMAVVLRGMTFEEMTYLTKEILESGEQIDLSSIDGICVDKHSTGGVGDKTTLVVGPIAAACGLKIAKMSGRGLGHTGGTLDKLESIPGFQIERTSEEFMQQVSKIGISVIGQTANIAPADKKLYSLRDVTATVDSIGLIASSIMSKKLASGAKYILLDVKVGEGAFMKTLEDARELAHAMVEIGKRFGRDTVAVLTDMSGPLGEMVGNSVEIIEAIDTLKGNGPSDFTALCVELSSEMLLLSKLADSKEEAVRKVEEVIKNKSALEKFAQMVAHQAGNPDVVRDYSLFGKAEYEDTFLAKEDGYIAKVDALAIGHAAMYLGAGRQKKEDQIDHKVGLRVHKKVGDKVQKGDVLVTFFTNHKEETAAHKALTDAFIIEPSEVCKKPIILDIIR